MLHIDHLSASINGVDILRDLSLRVGAGEVHAVMGPNGSGKSTMAKILAGFPYDVTAGSVSYQGQDLLAMTPEQRAQAGLFMAFQYPVEIPGISSVQFLKTALNSQRKARGESPLDAMDFLQLVKRKLSLVDVDERFLQRAVNVDFSGGEKKRHEILQMLVLEPQLAILDETDSGLDIDALRIVADGINHLRDADRAIVLVTHYQRLLNHVRPDHVHVLSGGRIVRSGGPDLALYLEEHGYGWLDKPAAGPVADTPAGDGMIAEPDVADRESA